MILQQVKALYDEYIAEVERIINEKKPVDGLFGMGRKIADDPCHDSFSDRLEKTLKEYAAEKPSSADVMELLAFIYTAQKEHRDPVSAYWLMNAVHGFTLELIGVLSCDEASALYELYDKTCTRSERFPVQKKVLKALKRASGK